MFTGDYSFFDYKYNIPGYTGQDYDGPAQTVYLAVSAVLLVVLLTLLRKTPKERVRWILRITGIFLVLLYIGKTAWETVYDVRLSGGFNTGLLPLDTCSIIMPAALLAGFGKGRVRRLAECWLATGSVTGGIGTMVRLNAFNYYPFFSFGAFYSMFWHFAMVALGLLLIVTGVVPNRESVPGSIFGTKTVLHGLLFHLLFSVIVIPVDFIFDFDFMLYRELGGIPVFEDVASKLTAAGYQWVNPLLMLVLYFLAFQLVWFLAWACRRVFAGRRVKAGQH